MLKEALQTDEQTNGKKNNNDKAFYFPKFFSAKLFRNHEIDLFKFAALISI